MRIENIEIRNYRLFRQLRLRNLPHLTIVVGANGSGKSTLFDVFTFLKDALTHNVAAAVMRRGGFEELVSRGSDGPIGITVQFRESGGRRATYILEITTQAGRVVVVREVLRYRRGQYGKPWHFVDFRSGEGFAITNESVYGQEGVKEERERFQAGRSQCPGHQGTGTVSTVPGGVGVSEPDRELAHLGFPHLGGEAQRGSGVRRAPVHQRRQRGAGRTVPLPAAPRVFRASTASDE